MPGQLGGVGEREDHGPSADPQLAKYGQHLVLISKNMLELAVVLKRFEQIFSRNILTQCLVLLRRQKQVLLGQLVKMATLEDPLKKVR